MATSESKGRFFLQNESIRIDSHNESNRIDLNRELECSTLRARPAHSCKTKKVHETISFLLVTVPNIYRLKKFTDGLSNKSLLIWLLTTPPHVKYVAILPCNLSLMACFADINVSQGCNICKVRWDF